MPEGYQVKKRNTDYFAKLCFNQYLFIYLFIFLHATVVSSDNCPLKPLLLLSIKFSQTHE